MKHKEDLRDELQTLKHKLKAAEHELNKFKWISVGESLPDPITTVLVNISNDMTDSSVCETIHQYSGEFILLAELAVNRADARPCVGVTHWMPLPEAPKL